MTSKLGLLEAILFITSMPLSVEELEKNLKIKRENVEKLLAELKEKYSNLEHGIVLSEMGGYRLVVKQDYLEKVAHLTPHADLSRGLLRVLAIIAYHEPVKQSEIVKIIGNRTYEYTKQLEERGLIRSEKKSRTKLLSTTAHFEEYFGIKRGKLKEVLQNEGIDKPGTDVLGQ